VIRLPLLFFAIAFFVAGCNDNKHTQLDEVTVKDSIKQANLMYTQQLVDLQEKTGIAELLCQGWELEEDLDAITNNNASMGMQPFRSFYFSVDSTFIKNPRNAMEFGRWLYNDAAKTITLNYQNGSKDVYKIAALSAKELIVINSGIGSITQLKFIAKGKRYIDKTQDPYYIYNNQWRIAPKNPENESLIRKRLKDCLHFYILFYKDNIAREETTISFYGLPTCLKWYAGGIFMVKEKDLNGNWFDCFYNKDQAMKAYKMMETIVGKKYQWPKEKMNWVKKNLLVLEQMYAAL
jgi:hypothetical protein